MIHKKNIKISSYRGILGGFIIRKGLSIEVVNLPSSLERDHQLSSIRSHFYLHWGNQLNLIRVLFLPNHFCGLSLELVHYPPTCPARWPWRGHRGISPNLGKKSRPARELAQTWPSIGWLLHLGGSQPQSLGLPPFF